MSRRTGQERPEEDSLLGHSHGCRHEGIGVWAGWWQGDGKESTGSSDLTLTREKGGPVIVQ